MKKYLVEVVLSQNILLNAGTNSMKKCFGRR